MQRIPLRSWLSAVLLACSSGDLDSRGDDGAATGCGNDVGNVEPQTQQPGQQHDTEQQRNAARSKMLSHDGGRSDSGCSDNGGPSCPAHVRDTQPLEGPPYVLPGGLKIVTGGKWGTQVQVTDGKRTAPLALPYFRKLRSVAVADPPDRIELSYEDSCCHPDPPPQRVQEHSFDALEARLTNVSGLRHHRAGRFEKAAAAFSSAARLDPSFELATTNLACALARSGKVTGALQALESKLRTDPIGTYLHILEDPDLQPLLRSPPVQGLKAKVRGKARIDVSKNAEQIWKMYAARSASLGLVAAVTHYESWNSQSWSASLVLLSAATGEKVGSLPLVSEAQSWMVLDEYDGTGAGSYRLLPSDYRRTKENVRRANRVLADLGFDDEGVVYSSFAASRRKNAEHLVALFPSQKLRLIVARDGPPANVRIERGSRRVFEGSHTFWDVSDPALLPTGRIVVIRGAQDEPEGGCSLCAEAAGLVLINYSMRE